MTTTLRRRLDNVVLRWQARLDSEWADRVLPWAAAVALFVVLALMALAKARSLDGATDLSAYTQAAWKIASGRAPVTTMTTDTNLWSQQVAFAFYPIGLATILLPTIPTLLLVQSAVLAVAVVPVWKIARRLGNLRTGAAATLMVVYALYPVMHNLNLDGFHPEVIAIPGLLAGFYFAFTDRWRLFAVCMALVVLARADLGIAVAGFGVLLAMSGHRRAGITTVAAALGWTLVCAQIIQPHFGDGSFPHLAAFAQFGDTPASVTWGMLTHPGEVLGRIFREENFNLLVVLLAPVVFLPVLAPRYLLPVVPLQVLYFVADVPADAVFGPQTVAITAFIFLATAMALAKIGRQGVERVTVDSRVLGAMLLAGTVFFVQSAASSPYREPWAWGGQDAVDAVRLDARDRIPRDATVRASSSILQILAERQVLYRLEPGERPDPAAAGTGVDWVVLDQREASGWTAVQRQIFTEGMETSGFRMVLDENGIQLYERDHP